MINGRHIFLWTTAGFLIWSSALIVLYGLHAYGCEMLWQPLSLRFVMAGVIVVHLVAFAICFFKRPRATNAYVEITNLTLWGGLAASFLTFIPALFLSSCL